MANESQLVLFPVYTPTGERITLEVENRYGPKWGISERLSASSFGQMAKLVSNLFALALKDVPVTSATIEFSIGVVMEEKALKPFVARGETSSLFKVAIQIEPHKNIEAPVTD
jgi:hypothetical protein